MAVCRLVATCIFFNDGMAQMPPSGGLVKQQYCRAASLHCARYLVTATAGTGSVPLDLFPGQVERARRIIESWAAVPASPERRSRGRR